MATLPAPQIRQTFLDYFKRHGHTIVKSSPLVPANDPTLLFTNAGMVQFKDVFVGAEQRPYVRAVTCQKCMRVSGKHNDLEEVGRTARHHTFFEMLGNFSFGDYFKEEAILRAWEFLTKEMALNPKRLWITVFGGEQGLPADEEAAALWRKISGLSNERILKKGMKDNFWAMGDTGPCGPCTEIHYNLQGEGSAAVEDFDNGRVVEIWNNVFMQFERKAGGELVPLPKPSVDTGMGLERLSAVLQGKNSNYDSDLFSPLLNAIAKIVGKPYHASATEEDVSMRVLADHARATAFLAADGIQPANEGRGYVMRRIMRRAIRHGKKLGMEDVFFHRVCTVVIDEMAEAYPELQENRQLINKVTELEEKTFRRTLDTGLAILEQQLQSLNAAKAHVVPGEIAFKLYDTYGFPKDLTDLLVAEKGYQVDNAGFDAAMEQQRERSRGGEVGGEAVASVYKELLSEVGPTTFIGYTHEDEPIEGRQGRWRFRDAQGTRYLEAESIVKAIVVQGNKASTSSGDVVEVILDPTPFYGESGGQVGDRGIVVSDTFFAEVIDCQKPIDTLTVTKLRILKGTVSVHAKVWAGYVPEIRRETRAHHSATHLLHAALRQILGDHVKQAGSLVDPDHLRFDYTHFEAPTRNQLKQIEDEANGRVQKNDTVITEVLPFDDAKKKGAIALFGEKYGDTVRVVSMGRSVEFCGGTHAKRTGDIGMILLTQEEAVASGVRRMGAEVGRAAKNSTLATHKRLEKAADILAQRIAPHADDGEPILLSIAKTVRECSAAVEELGALGTHFLLPDFRSVKAPVLPTDIGLVDARTIRDIYSGLIKLANSRGAEQDAVVAEYAQGDRAGILHAYLGWMKARAEIDKQLKKIKQNKLVSSVDSYLSALKTIGDTQLLTVELSDVEGKDLRDLSDQLRNKMGTGVLCLGSNNGGKVALLISVSKDLTNRFKAGELVAELAPLVGGKGGGRPDMAQAGGTKPEGLPSLFVALTAKLSV